MRISGTPTNVWAPFGSLSKPNGRGPWRPRFPAIPNANQSIRVDLENTNVLYMSTLRSNLNTIQTSPWAATCHPAARETLSTCNACISETQTIHPFWTT